MHTQLLVERSGVADEMPTIFRITKLLPFAPSDAKLEFQAEVWCTDSDIMDNACRLKDFCNDVRKRGAKGECVSITFAVARRPMALRIHPGKCILQFTAQENGRVIVSAELTAQPAVGPMNLLDCCKIHFGTTIDYLNEFALQLEKNLNITWRASLPCDEFVE